MALIGSATTWRQAIMATIDTTDLDAGEITFLENSWQAICDAHILHIVQNSLLLTAVTGTSPSGPVTGIGVGTPPISGIS